MTYLNRTSQAPHSFLLICYYLLRNCTYYQNANFKLQVYQITKHSLYNFRFPSCIFLLTTKNIVVLNYFYLMIGIKLFIDLRIFLLYVQFFSITQTGFTMTYGTIYIFLIFVVPLFSIVLLTQFISASWHFKMHIYMYQTFFCRIYIMNKHFRRIQCHLV